MASSFSKLPPKGVAWCPSGQALLAAPGLVVLGLKVAAVAAAAAATKWAMARAVGAAAQQA